MVSETTIACKFCSGKSFGEQSYFPGTTQRYFQQTFCYGRCLDCGSICNLGITPPDYENYATGKDISGLKVKRFVKFLGKCNVRKTSRILDYGCGQGALLLELRKLGYNVSGYEPYNELYSETLTNNIIYDVIYLTHVFEHINDYGKLFSDLKKCTRTGSLVITINPSASRIPTLDPSCKFQILALHAPFHLGIPSDRVVKETFSMNDFVLKLHLAYDVQRSGLKDNGCVSALLFRDLGGTKENLLNASLKRKIELAAKSPLKYFYYLFINRKDVSASTLVFERR